MEEDHTEESDDHNHAYSNTSVLKSEECQPSNAPMPNTSDTHFLIGNMENICSNRATRHKDSQSSNVDEDNSDFDSCGRSARNTERISVNSSLKFVNEMTADDYKLMYWPVLERAIEHLLTQSPMDHVCISYEQIYSHVYKCVCQQHSEQLYSDLMSKITSHLEKVSTKLQDGPPDSFIENFNVVLTQFTAALQCIVSVFIYLSKFYVETKLNSDLRVDMMKLFSDHVAEKHLNTLIPLLKTAHSMPFQVRPSTMASVVKGLYALQPDWAHAAPALFSRFIPQIHPPAIQSHLPEYAAQDQKLQIELSRTGFPRGDQSRKRGSEA